ncbi:hypothetical protein Tdes44962_MAKER07725 [Teratosphaeria destructans]|uniref:Uncharacterized protein n=1 Tax=Teratosphaeria destructans TaxID=418781 RepID=A0A9W7SYT0_9PEZI|nr:hypothetical protein Tdes44962_MAKER07725 [Teratosphaeria destructans]
MLVFESGAGDQLLTGHVDSLRFLQEAIVISSSVRDYGVDIGCQQAVKLMPSMQYEAMPVQSEILRGSVESNARRPDELETNAGAAMLVQPAWVDGASEEADGLVSDAS